MQISNLQDIFRVTDHLYQYLDNKDIQINDNGFPILRQDMFLDEWPDQVIPFAQRKNRLVRNPKRTLLCLYDRDQRLYPRLGRLLDEIDEYRNYMGVTGLDITITNDMDEEWQRAICLLNQLFLAVLAVNGIKVVLNTRTAALDASVVFESCPPNIMAASGFLGCSSISEVIDYHYIEKILTILPGKLILYGRQDKIVEEQLSVLDIEYRVYIDFHRLCKEVHYGR